MFQRGSGILLHITSLPSAGGIGDFGPAAYQFVDFLNAAGQKYWQILPLNPTDMVYGNCPYSSPSAFAINPLLISPELLAGQGLLKKDELAALPQASRRDHVDYPSVTESKLKLLEQAFQRFKGSKFENGEFAQFCEQNAFWLENYAAFRVLKDRLAGLIWSEWPQDLRCRQPESFKELRAKFALDLKRVKFLQYIAFAQWKQLRAYCAQKQVKLIGDIPIYVNEDSADVWAHPQLFKLGPDFKPRWVAGVPPDYFSKTGQRWGNPVYDWQKLKEGGYDWWMRRLEHNLKLFDAIRIDHFRGLLAYWEIPYGEPTAVNGHWEPGPGEDFLLRIKEGFPQLPIIAEDLGVITPDVTAAMSKFQLPGMKVLHFAFGGDPGHPYLPENYLTPCVVYTGTHDNNTTRGWYRSDASDNEKEFLKRYLQKDVGEQNVTFELIRLAMQSQAVIALIPMQDVLNLAQEARMNVPGTVHGNWAWRMTTADLNDALALRCAQMSRDTGR